MSRSPSPDLEKGPELPDLLQTTHSLAETAHNLAEEAHGRIDELEQQPPPTIAVEEEQEEANTEASTLNITDFF